MENRTRKSSEQFYVSTGHLPADKVVRELVVEAYERFKSDRQGETSQVYPALTKVPSRLFGICVPSEAVELYTRQCSLNVTARDLAVMGATLADGGVNPITKAQVVDASICHYVLAVMTTAGLYETSGDWLYEIGLPGKSGIGGGIVTVSPGKAGLGTFAPLLDAAGNSVKGQLAAKFLSQQLGMDLFVSKPERHSSSSSRIRTNG